jgi:hypothetical protein
MNNDLILRARLVEAGYSDEDIKKFIFRGGVKHGAGERFGDKFFGGKERMKRRGNFTEQEISNKERMNAATTQQDARNKYNEKQSVKGYEQANTGNAPLMQQKNIRSTKPDGTTRSQSPSQVIQGNMPQDQPPSDSGDSNLPVLQPVGNQPAQPEQPAPEQPAPEQPAPEQPAPEQPAPAQQPQQPAQGGNMGLGSNVQDMAQQFQAGQDMQTIQQGKGAKKQSYFKNRSGLGMAADFLTGGLTSQFGSTGGIARRKANKKSEQQNQNYQAAQGRMNQRAMGMSPVMTSFDNQLSAYEDIISLRKGIQERNTTTNLRR